MSIFDVVMEFKNLPYLATLGSVDAYRHRAIDLMNRNFLYLTKQSTLSQLPVIINKAKNSSIPIPVVKSEETRQFHFSVYSLSLMDYLQHYFDEIKYCLDPKVKEYLEFYLSMLTECSFSS